MQTKTSFLCKECGDTFTKWTGQCVTCNEWNTLEEFKTNNVKKLSKSNGRRSGGYTGLTSLSAKIDDVESQKYERIITGIGEFDRVTGGGVTIGSVNLLSGDPGAGKTTLLTKVTGEISKQMPCLYVTAEEATAAFKERLKSRLKVEYNNDNFSLMSEFDVDEIISEALRLKVKFLVVDSIQALQSNSYTGSAGNVSQVKGCAQDLNRFAKTNGITMIVVSHVTKNSETAGPAQLKHIVDSVLHIETNDSSVRTIRPSKNRFGDIDTIALFNMTETGMQSMDNPSKIFLSSFIENAAGSAVCCVRDGNRNLLLELQSLVTDSENEFTQRVCVGVNSNRLKMITAILKKHGKQGLRHDIYISLIGGLKLAETDTSADVALAASLVSSLNDKPLPKNMLWLGELSLSGEVRPVNGGVQRAQEAIKHGFKHIVIPQANYHQKMESTGVNVTKVTSILDVVNLVLNI